MSIRDFKTAAGVMLMVLSAASCSGGSEEPVVTPRDASISTSDAALAIYDAPTKFPREGCQPGSLGALDPMGKWLVPLPDNGGDLLLYVFEDNSALEATLDFAPVTELIISPDDLFTFRRLDEGSIAVDLCRLEPDDALYGYLALCSTESCSMSQVYVEREDPITER